MQHVQCTQCNDTHTHTGKYLAVVWKYETCYKKGADALTESIVFWIKDISVSVSNRKVNSIYSWRCTTMTMNRFIIASA